MVSKVKLSDDFQKYIKYLDEQKKFLCLSDWNVQLANDYEMLGSDEDANVSPDIYEKTIRITLGVSFKDLPDKEKYQVLFHELVHGRLQIMKDRIDEYSSFEEENFVNDIVRGFMKRGGL